MDILKGAYWKVSIDWKCVYWMKMCIFTENVSIKWKLHFDSNGEYWMKMCLLKGHKPLGINSDSYLFGNFFSTFSLSSLKTQETVEFFSQLSHSLPMPYRYFSSQWQFFVLIYTSYLKRWVDNETQWAK